MNRSGFRSGSGRVFAALCLFLFISIDQAAVGGYVHAEERVSAGETANVLWIDGPNWPSNKLDVHALANGTILRTSNCNGTIGNTELPQNGADAVANYVTSGYICGKSNAVELPDGTKISVARLPVIAGGAIFSNEAIFRDVRGVMNVVDLPSLPAPLPPTTDTDSARYEFARVENGQDGKATYILVIADPAAETSQARVSLSIRDELNAEIAVEYFDLVDGFAWYALKKKVRIGSIVMTAGAVKVGPVDDAAPVFAIATVGFDEGGSPRVIVPQLVGGAAASARSN